MAGRAHEYCCTVEWTGNLGRGTDGYASYLRDHVILRDGKPPISGSADPAFRSVVDRYNPEDMLLASLSACHMLWFLHLASDAGIIVTAYGDEPVASMRLDRGGGGRFT